MRSSTGTIWSSAEDTAEAASGTNIVAVVVVAAMVVMVVPLFYTVHYPLNVARNTNVEAALGQMVGQVSVGDCQHCGHGNKPERSAWCVWLFW